MNILWQSPEFQRLGYTLLHSLWQGALVFVVAAILLRVLKNKSPQTRYALACAALGAMVALAVGTYASLANQASPPVEMAQATAAPLGAITAAPQSVWLAHVIPCIPWLSVGWMIGVLVFSIRLFGGWCWLYLGIKDRASSAPSEWQWRVDALSRQFGIARKARLLLSDRVSAPLALGWIAPIVLLPASALLRLSPDALEAILAHELAHIRRHDFIVNLLQSIAEALFFYHPAAWWLSGRIRELREHCCDDAAVKHIGSPISYASALAALETLRVGYNPPQMAPAANGASLMKRVQRLLCVTEPTISGFRAGITAAVVFLLLGASALWGLESDNRRMQERQRIVIKDKNTSLSIRMKGQVKLDPGMENGVALEDGAALEIAGMENGDMRRFEMRRKGNEIKKTYRVNGQEKNLDFEAEAWIRERVQEIQSVQVRKSNFGGDDDNISFEITEDGKGGKDSRVIYYSNKYPADIAPMSVGVFRFDGETWDEPFADFDFNREGLAERLKEVQETLKENSKGLKLFLDGDLFDSIKSEVVLVAPGEGVYLSPNSKAKVYVGKSSEIAEDRKESVEREVERLKSLLERLQEKLKDLDAR